MSIQFLGDGTITSSKAFTTLSLENLAPSSSYVEMVQNHEVSSTDAGIVYAYKKGQRKRQIHITLKLLSEPLVRLLLDFVETIDGSNNWFTYQDETLVLKSAMTQSGSSSSTLLQSSSMTAANFTLGPITQWAFIISGATSGQRRRIYDFSATSALVSPAFGANVVPGDTFLLGVPVFLTSDIRFQRIPPNWYQAEFELTEKGN